MQDSEWHTVLSFLAARAVPGVESVCGNVYERQTDTGVVRVAFPPDAETLRQAPAPVRRLLGLGFDLEAARRGLREVNELRPLVERWPRLRVPGAWSGFELALRAVLGQQVSLQAARTLTGRLVVLVGAGGGMPSAEQVAVADLDRMGMPGSRRKSLRAVAEAAVSDPSLFEQSGGLEESVAKLRAIYGIGDWSANYIALRALGELDAFPASDLVLLQSAAIHLFDGRKPGPRELLDRAERWRPWRGYVAQLLWASAAASPTPSKRLSG